MGDKPPAVKRLLKVKANYGPLFMELSKNASSDQPCAVLRENDSNSADAGATKKHFSALPVLSGFAQFDNGCGISKQPKQVQVIDPITGKRRSIELSRLDAFLSIGASLKLDSKKYIGHKGQGSKLTLAGRSTFVLVTRVKDETPAGWFVQAGWPAGRSAGRCLERPSCASILNRFAHAWLLLLAAAGHWDVLILTDAAVQLSRAADGLVNAATMNSWLSCVPTEEIVLMSTKALDPQNKFTAELKWVSPTFPHSVRHPAPACLYLPCPLPHPFPNPNPVP